MPTHDLTVTNVPIGELHQHPRNANMGDVEAINESVVTNGFYSPLIVQKSTMQIIAGNHRFLVGLELGYTHLPCIILDVTDEQALRIMLADNRTTRLGRDDESELLDVLETLRATDLGYTGTGFDHRDYTALFELLNEPLDLGEPEQEDLEEKPEPRKDGLVYRVEPIIDDDGRVRRMVVFKPNEKQMSPHDLNTIIDAFGRRKLTAEEVEEIGVPSWRTTR